MVTARSRIDVMKTALESERSGIDTRALTQIGEGFRSIAYETASHIILVGKHPGASESFKREHRILPSIAASLPIAIPQPDLLIEPSDVFPCGLMAYPRITGTVLRAHEIDRANLSNIAIEMAGFLTCLHRVDTKAFQLDVPDPRRYAEKLRDQTLPTLMRNLEDREVDRMIEWWASYLENDENFTFTPTFVHGDLWYENLILTEDLQHLSGVIDFETCGLKDPAADFAPLTYLGSTFCRRVLSEYARDCEVDAAAFDRRIQHYAELREFGGLRYAIKHDDRKEFGDAIRKLRQGTILNRAG